MCKNKKWESNLGLNQLNHSSQDSIGLVLSEGDKVINTVSLHFSP